MATLTGQKNLIIVGDRVFAEIAHEYFTHDSEYDVVAFSVEAEYRRTDEFRGLPLVDFEHLPDLYDPAKHSVFVALTYAQINRVRTRLADAAQAMGYGLASYVSSRSFVWRNVEIGEHCFIFEDNTLQPFVTIGRNCILWSGNHIGHHSTIRDNVFMASHVVVSGGVTIENNAFIGVNATIVNDITIGADCWIGPAVTLTRDVESGTVWQPARSNQRDIGSLELFGLDS